jgi:hypothetical protein
MQSAEDVHDAFWPPVPEDSQNVNQRIWPACSRPSWHEVPATEQLVLVMTSQLLLQSISLGTEPPIPSLICSAQIPPTVVQSASVAQNATHSPWPDPRQMEPGSHLPVVHAAPGVAVPAVWHEGTWAPGAKLHALPAAQPH